MLTGIMEEVDKIQSIHKGRDPAAVSIDTGMILGGIRLGDNVAVSGVRLIITSLSQSGLTADVMHEILDRSSLGNLYVRSPVDLERVIPASNRFGGHTVSEYIDGTGTISVITKGDNTIWYIVKMDPPILRYVIEEDSVAIDGVSLIAVKVHSDGFSVSITPHTVAQTILPEKRIGDIFNLENDCIAKCVERLLGSQSPETTIATEFLAKHGF